MKMITKTMNENVKAVNELAEAPYGNGNGSYTDSQWEGKEEHIFILQRGAGNDSAVSALIRQVWEELPDKDWFAIDEPGYLSHILGLQSTLVFEARTLTSKLSDEPVDEPTDELAAICVLVEPETEEESLAPYAEIPRSEWHRVMHVDIAATLPAYRGHSLQSRLMDYAACFLRIRKDTKFLMATVHPNNAPSRRSMEKLGYTCVAQTTLYGGLPRCVYCKRL
ncbi:GNAT family N-acetyltransferase [uncultured Bacteroides sp.]|jgi:GNAT superfamily N-acetyltransferase|uniref:GNAT family N-acetyltransferase n=1 Tax=uncultured Bacteroides sp. TaxID=162156 RepID=UPI0025E85C5E|nr:GNAT family N-acetyltransferase [uncultured Bacteroides sp.]